MEDAAILTTGDVTSMLSCSPRLVVQLFDAGELLGWRLPKGDRRITRASLLAYCRRSGIPLGFVGLAGLRVLCLSRRDPEPLRLALLEHALGLEQVASLYALGRAAEGGVPPVAVLDCSLGVSDCLEVAPDLGGRAVLLQTEDGLPHRGDLPEGAVALPGHAHPEAIAAAAAELIGGIQRKRR